uniref:Uncharacterized protein n=1 Tax=Pipistrellus kuhlii TaxID=59472 RepID=A0A7J7VMI2_PIPKU|nr:hypothetical protein mPipKuh1_008430 [Pipistrellus kuhlii]
MGPDAAALVEWEDPASPLGYLKPVPALSAHHLVLKELKGPDSAAPVDQEGWIHLLWRTGPDTPAAGLRGLGATILWLWVPPCCCRVMVNLHITLLLDRMGDGNVTRGLPVYKNPATRIPEQPE